MYTTTCTISYYSQPGMWKRKQWKRLNFCGSGSTLKKEDGNGSKLGSILFFEEPEAKAFFSTLKKEAGSGSKLGSD